MKNKLSSTREAGAVSILTVTMFILLFAVLVVSFTSIMTSTARQTQNDELIAKATAAAESGIEDAKRILAYCKGNDDPDCDKLQKIDEQTCDTVISSLLPKVGAAAGTVDTANNEVSVGAPEQDQHYLCMKISTVTKDFVGIAPADGSSTIIHLNDFCSTSSGLCKPDNIASIDIEWSSVEDGRTGGRNGSDFPSVSQWNDVNNAPAVLRIEMVTVPASNSSFSTGMLVSNSRAATLRPTLDTGAGVIGRVDRENNEHLSDNNAINITALSPSTTPNGVTKIPLQPIKCSTSAAFTYACAATLKNGPGQGNSWVNGSGNNAQYYLRIQAIYSDTHFRVSAFHPSGETLYLSWSQPEVDVTGRSSDAFRRIVARVGPASGDGSNVWYPEYAIDSATAVCKNLMVLGNTGEDLCKY